MSNNNRGRPRSFVEVGPSGANAAQDKASQIWADKYWTSHDGLKLHYRDYQQLDVSPNADRPILLCIPGLTRNARDFHNFANDFSRDSADSSTVNYRVVCAELRGRGGSDYAKDPASYTAENYAADILALIDQANFGKVVLIGTSLGGLVSMLIASQRPDCLAGVVLNDIGPHIEPEGLERIRTTSGYGRSFSTWIHAAWALRESTSQAHPAYEISDWLDMAKRLLCLSGNGRITYDYDMRITEALQQQQSLDDQALWSAFRALCGIPSLIVRGELSDILSVQTMDKMLAEMPQMAGVTVPNIGHVPSLDEDVARSAIAQLLAKVA